MRESLPARCFANPEAGLISVTVVLLYVVVGLGLCRLGIALPKPPFPHGAMLAATPQAASPFGAVPRTAQPFAMWLSRLSSVRLPAYVTPLQEALEDVSPQLRLVRATLVAAVPVQPPALRSRRGSGYSTGSNLASASVNAHNNSGNSLSSMSSASSTTPNADAASGRASLAQTIDPVLAVKCLSLSGSYSVAMNGTKDVAALEHSQRHRDMVTQDDDAVDGRTKPDTHQSRYSLFGKSRSIPERPRSVVVSGSSGVPGKPPISTSSSGTAAGPSGRFSRSATVNYRTADTGMSSHKSASLAARSVLSVVEETRGPIVGTGETDVVQEALETWYAHANVTPVRGRECGRLAMTRACCRSVGARCVSCCLRMLAVHGNLGEWHSAMLSRAVPCRVLGGERGFGCNVLQQNAERHGVLGQHRKRF